MIEHKRKYHGQVGHSWIRPGFTIVELLVAMALTLFVMTILSQAFVTSLETFSGLKGIGDMDAGLRTAATMLQYDLQQDHFETGRKLSDTDFWNAPVREGFFHIRQGSGSVVEGKDGDYLWSYRATNHILHFTSKLRGRRRENFYSTSVPAGSKLLSPFPTFTSNWTGEPHDSIFQEGQNINSQWSEIAYFLKQTGTVKEPNNPSSTLGTPLWSLYRSQYLVLPKNEDANAAGITSAAGYEGFSLRKNWASNGIPITPLNFNTPNDLTNSGNRSFNPANPFAPTWVVPAWPKPPILLTNVVSFNVRVLKRPPGGFGNNFVDFDDLGAASFDSSGASPGYDITGLQIILRVWDQRSQQTRQFTLIQDM